MNGPRPSSRSTSAGDSPHTAQRPPHTRVTSAARSATQLRQLPDPLDPRPRHRDTTESPAGAHGRALQRFRAFVRSRRISTACRIGVERTLRVVARRENRGCVARRPCQRDAGQHARPHPPDVLRLPCLHGDVHRATRALRTSRAPVDERNAAPARRPAAGHQSTRSARRLTPPRTLPIELR